MTDIFLSYAQIDRDRVEPLARALGQQGWTVWWDPAAVGGVESRDEIRAELGAARCVIVVWSAGSVESPWVREEAQDALERGILVPITVGVTRPPSDFRSLHTLPMAHWDGSPSRPDYLQLVEMVGRILDEPESGSEHAASSEQQGEAGWKIHVDPAPHEQVEWEETASADEASHDQVEWRETASVDQAPEQPWRVDADVDDTTHTLEPLVATPAHRPVRAPPRRFRASRWAALAIVILAAGGLGYYVAVVKPARVAQQEAQERRLEQEAARLRAEQEQRLAEAERLREESARQQRLEAERARAAQAASEAAEAEAEAEAERRRAARRVEIEALLANAETALGKDRLTTPPGNNAFEYLRAAQRLDPQNPDVQSGLERIVDRYLALASRAIGARSWRRADRFLGRAELIGVAKDRVLALRADLARSNQE